MHPPYTVIQVISKYICFSQEHSKHLKEKNSMMVMNVNNAIGETICLESADLVDVSNVEVINFEGNKVTYILNSGILLLILI